MLCTRTILRRFRFVDVAGGAVLFGLLTASIAQAAPPNMDEARQACINDVFRLCNQYVPNAGPIAACLRRNVRSLSPECHRVLVGSRPVVRRVYRRRRT
jgi:hypothetical protein